MPRPEKPALLSWLYRSEFETIVPLKKVLQRGAREVLGKDGLAAEAYAESNLNTFWNYVLEKQEADAKRGISRVFEVADSMAHTLHWCSPASHSRSTQARNLARLRHRPSMLKMIDALSDREYEALACISLRLVGASEVNLTPPGNEGGVDFFALIASPGRCHLFSGANHPLRIIGQSKKYTGAVQVGVFKEFLKTIDEVKYGGEPKTERIVPPWFHAVPGPIIALMIAHQGFQSGAVTRARRHGVIIADSLDMAEIVALSRGLPEHMASLERTEECRSRIHALVGSARVNDCETLL